MSNSLLKLKNNFLCEFLVGKSDIFDLFRTPQNSAHNFHFRLGSFMFAMHMPYRFLILNTVFQPDEIDEVFKHTGKCWENILRIE